MFQHNGGVRIFVRELCRLRHLSWEYHKLENQPALGKLGEAVLPGFVRHRGFIDAGGAVLGICVPIAHLPDAAKIGRFAVRVQQPTDSRIG